MADMEASASNIVDASDHNMTVFLDAEEGLHNASVSGSNTDMNSDDEGPPYSKKARTESEGITETFTIDWNDDNVKQTIYNVNRALSLRLDSLEQKYDELLRMVQDMHEKMVTKDDKTLKPALSGRGSRGTAIVVGLPSTKDGTQEIQSRPTFSAPTGNVTLITLNSQEDYPNGVWLGDENNPEMRVRVNVSPSDLLHIHSNCRTAEKMALTLLDYLFDRDTQALSNLSGTGKHGKKQLDPLLIYGIRCHLIHRFSVTEEDWYRIRLNIDSKCRTAFRRKMRGQPMSVKAFRGKDGGEFLSQAFTTITPESSGVTLHDDSQLRIQEHLSLDGQTGELQIIHATEEQLVQLQQSHQIQILDDNQVPAELLQQLQQQAGSVDVQVAVTPLGDEARHSDDLTAVDTVTVNGDVVHIQQTATSDSTETQ